jgi:hypothetical protein
MYVRQMLPADKDILSHQIEDTPALFRTNDPSEAFRFCRAAMKREDRTLACTSNRDIITGREFGGLDVFQFANEFVVRIME